MSSTRRPLRLPPPNFDSLGVPVRECAAQTLIRVHERGLSALYFSRNPDHRFSHPGAPFPFLYLGDVLETCLFERFGDEMNGPECAIPQGLWFSRCVSTVRVPKLRMCDLTSKETWSRAKIDLAAVHHHDLAVPQQWGLAIQNHPTGFQGIIYPSRFHGICFVIFDRGGLSTRLREYLVNDLGPLEDADRFLAAHRVTLV